ncbi:MAG: hypothetical protein JW384_02667 [Nitrosomonadaceae bacterium]|nr:hypothetical protein [Nitrosomonadaceae bacterium]
MQPVKLLIRGDFWDSYLYRGRLYIWTMENDLYIYDWDRLVESLGTSYLRLPLVCAFSRGDLLYKPLSIRPLFDDKEVRSLLFQKFSALKSELDLDITDLAQTYRIGSQDSPFPTIHDDLTFHSNQIFALTEQGLHYAETHKPLNRKSKVGRMATKFWDGQGTSIRAKGGLLAVAAADDGLFEFEIDDLETVDPTPVTSRHTIYADWAFASIYGSSDLSTGYLAAYIDSSGGNRYYGDHSERRLIDIIDESEIFDGQFASSMGPRFSWGVQDKLYLVIQNSVHAIRYSPWEAGSLIANKEFSNIGSISMDSVGSPISGATSHFGLVAEYDGGLSVISSDGEPYFIKGPVVRWRVFPRSIRYENQLHVITEDSLEIYSFNGDYFVDQKQKFAGTQVWKSEFADRLASVRMR